MNRSKALATGVFLSVSLMTTGEVAAHIPSACSNQANIAADFADEAAQAMTDAAEIAKRIPTDATAEEIFRGQTEVIGAAAIAFERVGVWATATTRLIECINQG